MSSSKFKNLFVKHNGINWDEFEKMNLFFTNNHLVYTGHCTDIESQILDCNYFITKKADFNKIVSYSYPECVTGLSFY